MSDDPAGIDPDLLEATEAVEEDLDVEDLGDPALERRARRARRRRLAWVRLYLRRRQRRARRNRP